MTKKPRGIKRKRDEEVIISSDDEVGKTSVQSMIPESENNIAYRKADEIVKRRKLNLTSAYQEVSLDQSDVDR